MSRTRLFETINVCELYTQVISCVVADCYFILKSR